MDHAQQLARGLAAKHPALGGEPEASLLRYIETLYKWNATHNLTAIRNESDAVTLHILDSLSVLPHVGVTRLADLGTGGGLPGIPLAIAVPGMQVTLIEANGKKCAFLRHCLRELNLENIEVVQARGEEYTPQVPFDAVISRAFSSLSDFVEMARPLTRPGGSLLAMKGQLPKAEMDALENDLEITVHRLVVPGLDAERHLIELSLPAAT